MRIKRVRVQNFRCLEDVDIEFDRITTLIGPNGSGKSTVLRALDWFFNGTKGSELTESDLTIGAAGKNVVVEVEFHQLTDDDRSALGGYVADGVDRFVAWKYHSEDGSEKMTSNARTFIPFDSVRSVTSAAEKKASYNALRTDSPELELPAASSALAVEDALRAWELEHLDQLTESQQTVTNFFGFNSNAAMAGVFDYVLVTADLRAGEETQDSKATIIGRILERAINRESADAKIAALTEETRTKQQAIYKESFEKQLSEISSQLSIAVGRYTTGRQMKLQPAEFDLRPPKTQFRVTVLDDSIETPITGQGHGFQRTLLISALQLLANHGTAGQSGTFCLAIEEPELFQHPVQAQAFATVLRQLAADDKQRLQVAYATHSPYFLSAGHFDEVRRVTRMRSIDGQTPRVAIASTSAQDVLARLAGYMNEDRIRRQIDGVCLSRLPEALFASAAVLVEGTTDRAILEGCGQRPGQEPLSISGIVVAETGGKENLYLPYAILSELGIPCYVVFDGDRDCGDRMREKGKDQSAIEKAEQQNQRENEKLLLYLQEQEESWPETSVNDTYAVINDTLESQLQADWDGWTTAKDQIVASGLGSPDKNSLIWGDAARLATTDPPPWIVDLLAKIRALESLN